MDYGFEVVDAPEDSGITQVWADPRTLAEKPDNPREHPVEQTQAIQDSIDRYGWLAPLVYNARTKRIVEGHDRLRMALRQNRPAVPVWVGDWREEDEAGIVLVMHETGPMGKYDPSKTRAMLAKLGQGGGETIQSMVARLSSRENLGGLLEAAGRASKSTEVPERSYTGTREKQEETPRQGPVSQEPKAKPIDVRMVQLLTDQDGLDRFQAWDEVLLEHWSLNTTTEVVMKAMHDSYVAALRNGIGRR